MNSQSKIDRRNLLQMGVIAASSVAMAPLTANSAENISVTSFGAVGDGSTDNTASIAAAAAALQAKGGGSLIFPRGTYNVAAVKSRTLFSFSNLNGITIHCMDGATIADKTTYSGTQYASLFDFTACRNIDIRLRVASQIAVTTSGGDARGLWAVTLYRGCQGVKIDLDAVGCLGGLRATKQHSEPASYKSRAISGKIRARGTEYAYVTQFGSEQVNLSIEADTCFRPFYLYGSSSQRLNVRTRNIQGQAIIGAFSGYGCEDVEVHYFDRDSTANQAAAPRLYLHWGDRIPATHRNIRLHLNLKNPASPNNWGHTLGIVKFSDGGTTPDVTGRGHILDGLEITGRMEGDGSRNHFNMDMGAFASPDVMKNIHIHDLTLTGGSAFAIPLNRLDGTARFVNVKTDHNIYTFNPASGLVIFEGCTAANFTAATNSAERHEYRGSVVTGGTAQNYSTNKRFSGKGLIRP